MSMENIAGARKPAKREDEHTVAGEHRMMRRADREVTNPEQIAAIVAACDIVEVAYADAEGLTIVPLNFGFDYDEATGKLTLWFHSAPRGASSTRFAPPPVADCPWLSPCRPTARWWRAAPRAIGARCSSRSSAMARRHWSRIWMNAATACRR